MASKNTVPAVETVESAPVVDVTPERDALIATGTLYVVKVHQNPGADSYHVKVFTIADGAVVPLNRLSEGMGATKPVKSDATVTRFKDNGFFDLGETFTHILGKNDVKATVHVL